MIGRNTDVGQELASFVERFEACMAAKQMHSDEGAAVLSEAKARGFVPKAIRAVVKLRAMKPQDRQEAEILLSTYLHALGDETDTPLFRHVGQMSIDIASREQVMEALKPLVPSNGSIIVETGGQAFKLTRDKDGAVDARPYVEPAAAPRATATPSGAPSAPTAGKAPPPDVDADTAEALGRAAFRDNEPIIRNPFPFGDDRRPRWDLGWRKESGSDGMGPGKGEP